MSFIATMWSTNSDYSKPKAQNRLSHYISIIGHKMIIYSHFWYDIMLFTFVLAEREALVSYIAMVTDPLEKSINLSTQIGMSWIPCPSWFRKRWTCPTGLSGLLTGRYSLLWSCNSASYSIFVGRCSCHASFGTIQFSRIVWDDSIVMHHLGWCNYHASFGRMQLSCIVWSLHLNTGLLSAILYTIGTWRVYAVVMQ